MVKRTITIFFKLQASLKFSVDPSPWEYLTWKVRVLCLGSFQWAPAKNIKDSGGRTIRFAQLSSLGSKLERRWAVSLKGRAEPNLLMRPAPGAQCQRLCACVWWAHFRPGRSGETHHSGGKLPLTTNLGKKKISVSTWQPSGFFQANVYGYLIALTSLTGSPQLYAAEHFHLCAVPKQSICI